MNDAVHIQLSVRLPTRLLFAGAVSKLQAVGEDGAFGLLPHHCDLVTALQPSVLSATLLNGEERFFGIDHGLLIKRGFAVDVVVPRAVADQQLDRLAQTVAASFSAADEDERQARTAMSRLEVGIVRQLGLLQAGLSQGPRW